MSEPTPPPTAELLDHLASADFELLGRMPWSSNHTFLVELDRMEGWDRDIRGIYKPERGERPLWDFPGSLYKREVAAYALCAQLGWDVIPPTVICGGPHGVGSLQLFIDADFEQHYFTVQGDAAFRPRFEKIAVFDLLANNTDRKSGHCLIVPPDGTFGIDNALCFHEDFKLRTVLWDYAGEPIDPALLVPVQSLVDDGLGDDLANLLYDQAERDAVIDRAQFVLDQRVFPSDPTGRRYPWPLV